MSIVPGARVSTQHSLELEEFQEAIFLVKETLGSKHKSFVAVSDKLSRRSTYAIAHQAGTVFVNSKSGLTLSSVFAQFLIR